MTLDPPVVQCLTPSTGVQFEPTDQSYKHLIEFARSAEPKQPDADLQTYFAAVEQCSASSNTTPGASVVTIIKLTIPKLGDQLDRPVTASDDDQ